MTICQLSLSHENNSRSLCIGLHYISLKSPVIYTTELLNYRTTDANVDILKKLKFSKDGDM
jgi:hypothetical protein